MKKPVIIPRFLVKSICLNDQHIKKSKTNLNLFNLVLINRFYNS